MKNFFRIIGFLFLFCLFGCLGIVDESLISSVSFKITIPEFIQSGKTSVAKNATTENLKLVVSLETKESDEVRTEEKTVSGGQTVSISFDEIPVGNEIRIVGKLYNSENTVIYEGESEWTIIQAGKNEVELLMKKVIVEEEVIVNAEKPEIIKSVNSFVFVKGSDVDTTNLECSAKSKDGGVISFQWQVQNAKGEWENVEDSDVTKTQAESLYTSVLSVSVSDFELNETKYYKCIVTNTNNEVNGTTTASEETTATVAYVEGTLSSITAKYTGVYELFGSDINLENITVTERWVSNEKSFDVVVLASSNRYSITKKANEFYGENVIGNVPYTLSYKDSSTNSDATLTYDLVIPVKYKLSTDAIKLVCKFDGNTVAMSDNGTETSLNVPQYGTVEYEISPADIGNGLSIVNNDGTVGAPITPSDFDEYYSATITKDGTVVENEAVWDDDKETSYDVTVTLMSGNEWFVCEENQQKRFVVAVYSWEMSVDVYYKNSTQQSILIHKDSKNDTYVVPNYVSAINVTASTKINDEEFIFDLYKNDEQLSNGTITVQENLVITAKVGDKIIGTITVETAAIGSEALPVTDWNDLVSLISPLASNNEDELVIYISGKITETEITVDVDNDGKNETPAVNRPVRIKPKGNVTIERSCSYNNPLFFVNENFIIEGDSENKVCLEGGGDEICYPLVYCESDVSVNLNYCELKNANCGNDSYGSALYAGNGSSVTMNNCMVSNNIGVAIVLDNTGVNSFTDSVFSNNTAVNTSIFASAIYLWGSNNVPALTLENCSFDNNGFIAISGENKFAADLGIENGAVTMNSCNFCKNDPAYFNVYTYVCSELLLNGNMILPRVFFDNTWNDAELNIKQGENLSLKSENSKIGIQTYHTENYDGETLDLDLFDETFSLDMFELLNEGYSLTEEGTFSQDI